jgi:mono/diheme cytochrome c family protein
MSPQTIAITIPLVALALFAVAYFIVGPAKRRKGPERRGDIPLAMRPYHSDDELETTGMERAMAWGVALTLFASVFLPVYLLIEPERIADKVDEYYEHDVIRGRFLFAEACASCHGTDAGGGSAPNPDPDISAPWPAPSLDNIVARYAENPNVTDIRGFMLQTIKQGRPGTPMPAWGAFYGGPYIDMQVENIVEYLLSIQTGGEPEAVAVAGASGDQLFQDNCARCHGANGQGWQNEPGLVGPSLQDVFARYGATGEGGDADEQARSAIVQAIVQGRMVPTGASMPAWGNVLPMQAIERIVDHLRSIQEGTSG